MGIFHLLVTHRKEQRICCQYNPGANPKWNCSVCLGLIFYTSEEIEVADLFSRGSASCLRAGGSSGRSRSAGGGTGCWSLGEAHGAWAGYPACLAGLRQIAVHNKLMNKCLIKDRQTKPEFLPQN